MKRINWKDKIDSPELVLFLSKYGEEHYLSASNINEIIKIINEHDDKLSGRFLINRNNRMFFANEPLIGDTVTGMVEGEYLNAGTFYGGNFEQLSSYVEDNSVGKIISFVNGNVTYQLREEVINRPADGEFPIAVMYITTQGTIQQLSLYENIIEDIGDMPFGAILSLNDPQDEFEDSQPYVIPELSTPYFRISSVSNDIAVLQPNSHINNTDVYRMVKKLNGVIQGTQFFSAQSPEVQISTVEGTVYWSITLENYNNESLQVELVGVLISNIKQPAF